jgi:hypothetical protein
LGKNSRIYVLPALAFVSDRGEARIWKIPEPVPGDVERLELWTQVQTGLELTANGAARYINARTREQCWKRLQELGGAP